MTSYVRAAAVIAVALIASTAAVRVRPRGIRVRRNERNAIAERTLLA